MADNQYVVKTNSLRWLYLMTKMSDADLLRSMAADLQKVMAEADRPAPMAAHPVPPTTSWYLKQILTQCGQLPDIENGSDGDALNKIVGYLKTSEREQAKLVQIKNDLTHEVEQLRCSNKFFRDGFQQMKKATGEGDGYLDSALVADVIEMAKHDLELDETLRQIHNALGLPAMAVSNKRALEDIICQIKNRAASDAERRKVSAGRFDLLQKLQVAVGGTTHIETVDLACRRSDILDKLMAASGFSESDGVDTAVSVLKYRLAVTERADTIVPDSYPGDTPTYLAECEIAKGKLDKIKAVFESEATHSNAWVLNRVEDIIHGN